MRMSVSDSCAGSSFEVDGKPIVQRGGGEGDMVLSSKMLASSCQGALPSREAVLVYGRYIDRLLLRGQGLIPVQDVLGVGIPYRPVVW